MVGGCFDVLHQGHKVFLEKAKQEGDYLIVLLESDEKIKALKGVGRPVQTQKERAKALAFIDSVDFIVLLPNIKANSEYDELISRIKPDILAVTEGQASIHHQRVAKLVGAKIKTVTKMIGDYSTTKLLRQ